MKLFGIGDLAMRDEFLPLDLNYLDSMAKEAYEDGKIAFHNGFYIEDNEYILEEEDLQIAWDMGWNKAKEESK